MNTPSNEVIVEEAIRQIKKQAEEKFVPISFRLENDIRLIIQSAIDKATERYRAFIARCADHMISGSNIADTPLPTEREWRDILSEFAAPAQPQEWVCGTCGASATHPESRAAQPQEWMLEHRDDERSDIFTNTGELICAGVKTSRAKIIKDSHNATLKP